MRLLVHKDGSVVPLDNFEVFDFNDESEAPCNSAEDLDSAVITGVARKMQKVENGAVVWRIGDGVLFGK